MYIRIKPVKSHEYAYLIENKWDKRTKKIKKRFKAYFGKVHRVQRTNNLEPDQIIFETLAFKQIIKHIINLELKNHGFKEKNGGLYADEITLDLNNLQVLSADKPITLLINEGFLNSYTLDSLLNFEINTASQINEGKKLAKLLVLSGIKIKPEQFISLFQKLYKNKQE